MKLSNIELRRIHLELVTPFRTSFGEQTAREILLIGVTSDDGTVGWGVRCNERTLVLPRICGGSRDSDL